MSVATPLSSTKTQSSGATAVRASCHAVRAATTSSRVCSSGQSVLFFPPQVEPIARSPDGVNADHDPSAGGVEHCELREGAVVALRHERAQHLGTAVVDFPRTAPGVRLR